MFPFSMHDVLLHILRKYRSNLISSLSVCLMYNVKTLLLLKKPMDPSVNAPQWALSMYSETPLIWNPLLALGSEGNPI